MWRTLRRTDLSHSLVNHGLNHLCLFPTDLKTLYPRDDLLAHPLSDPVAITLSFPSPLINQQPDAPEGIISGDTLCMVSFNNLILKVLPRELLEQDLLVCHIRYDSDVVKVPTSQGREILNQDSEILRWKVWDVNNRLWSGWEWERELTVQVLDQGR
jgi:hypothetical protein